MRLVAIAFAAAVHLTGTAAGAPAAPIIADGELAGVFAAHVRAVETRDLDALQQTLTGKDALELILPNGKRMTTKAEYVELHREWFKSANWTWTCEPVASAIAADMAVVTTRTHYEERDGTATTWSENWLALTFRKEAGGWRLVHDQNTRIRTGP